MVYPAYVVPTIPVTGVVLVTLGRGKLTTKFNGAVPDPVTFVAVNVAAKVPAVVGVPLMKPDVLIPSPVGNPVALKLVGLLSAVALKVKGPPTMAIADCTLVIIGAGGLIVRVKVAVPVPLALKAPIVGYVSPSAVGVPEIIPWTGSRVNPAGSPVTA